MCQTFCDFQLEPGLVLGSVPDAGSAGNVKEEVILTDAVILEAGGCTLRRAMAENNVRLMGHLRIPIEA